jgi:hypothetical protein
LDNGLLTELRRMRITGPGLATISVLTAILWGCLVAEHRTVAHARAEAYRALSEIRALQLKKHIMPAAAPVRPQRGVRPEIG